jgi:hypothetical protein
MSDRSEGLFSFNKNAKKLIDGLSLRAALDAGGHDGEGLLVGTALSQSVSVQARPQLKK